MKRTLLLCIALFGACILNAQQDAYFYQYRTQAIEYQQAVKAAQKGIESADSKVDAAQAGFYPRVDAKGDYQFFAQPIQLGANENSPAGDQLQNQYQVGLFLIQLFYIITELFIHVIHVTLTIYHA